jgi:amino acid adenylation domain-containing protein
MNNEGYFFALQGAKKYSFKDLDEKAREIESLLNKRGINNSRICVVSGRNIMLYAAVVAILRTNNSYIPLSKDNSCKRIEELSNEAGSSSILYLDEDDYHLEITKNKFLKEHDEVYVMFSSGTTGKPKGIIIDEPGLINNLDWGIDEFKINKNTKIFFKEKIIFDISIWEIFFPLVSGCQVVIFPDDDERYIEKIKQTVERHKINWTYCMFSQGIQLLEVLNNYEGQFLFGAECFNPSSLEKLKRFTNAKFHNTYGPTETTITCTSYPIDVQKDNVPIGKPIQNTTIYLMDENQKTVAPGVKGEICIGGPGVGLGYINNDEKNKLNYISSSISQEPVYRSGDYGYVSNEVIEFLGRDINDSQKKFKGYRIDLKQIEGAINELPNVSLAIVQIYEERQLLASVKLKINTEINDENWKKELSNKLPYYMIPDYFEIIEEFPLMQNGKIDKDQLFIIHKDVVVKKAKIDKLKYPVNTVIEKDVARIWRDVLHNQGSIDNRNANFFNLGGSSLDVPKVTYQIYQKFGIEIESFQVYKYPTIELFAKYIEGDHMGGEIKSGYDLDYNLLLSQIKELCNETQF